MKKIEIKDQKLVCYISKQGKMHKYNDGSSFFLEERTGSIIMSGQ